MARARVKPSRRWEYEVLCVDTCTNFEQRAVMILDTRTYPKDTCSISDDMLNLLLGGGCEGYLGSC